MHTGMPGRASRRTNVVGLRVTASATLVGDVGLLV